MAEETKQPEQTQPEAPKPEHTQDAAKTFTQDEVNELIKARLERERKNTPTKDELQAFREWQENSKTAEQKHADEIAAAKTALTAAEKRAELLEAQFAAIKKGVSPDAVEDVVALAQVKVSDTVPLSKAIDEVIKKYPQFAAAKAPERTGVPLNSGGAEISGVEKRFLEKNPGLKI